MRTIRIYHVVKAHYANPRHVDGSYADRNLAWLINALNSPGFQRRIRSDDLASYVESGVPFPTRLGALQCLISHVQRRKMIEGIEQAIQELQNIFHRLAVMVHEQSEDLKRLAKKEHVDAVLEE